MLTKTIEQWLLDVWYEIGEKNRPIVYFYGFDENSVPFVLRDATVKPHFFSSKRVKDSTPSLLKEDSFKQKVFWKVCTDIPEQVPRAAERIRDKYGFTTYANDIYFTQVAMKELGIVPSSWNRISAKVLAEDEIGGIDVFDVRIDSSQEFFGDYPKLRTMPLDIESYNPRGGMPDSEKDPILCMGLDDSVLVGTERAILKSAIRRIRERKANIILTYNGNDFDWDYIGDRCSETDVDFEIGWDGAVPHRSEYSSIAINGCPTIDLYGYAYYTGSKRKTQPAVHAWMANEGLFNPRKFYDIDRNRIAQIWDSENREDVIKHCKSDIELTGDIGRAVLPFAIMLSRVSKTPLDQVLSVPALVLMEHYLFRYAKRLGYVIPNKKERERSGSTGAIVLPPRKGLFKNVVVFDFKSMYPNVAVKYNISFETFQDGQWLDEPMGMFAVAIKDLIVDINEAKKRFKAKYSSKYAGEIQGIKVLGRALSPHGYLGYRGARWYSLEAKEYELRKCRAIITKTVFVLRRAGYEVIYGDTDSVFVLLKEYNEQVVKRIQELIQKEIGLEVDWEYLKKIFFTEAKKKYIYIDKKGELNFVGFESVRGDWCELAKRTQRRVAEIVLKEENVEKAFRYSKYVVNRVKEYPLEDFVILKGLSQEIEQYTSTLAHVEVAKKHGTDISGKVEYVVRKGDGRLADKAIHPSEVRSIAELDFEYYIWKQIASAADRILGYFIEDFLFKLQDTYYKPPIASNQSKPTV